MYKRGRGRGRGGVSRPRPIHKEPGRKNNLYDFIQRYNIILCKFKQYG